MKKLIIFLVIIFIMTIGFIFSYAIQPTTGAPTEDYYESTADLLKVIDGTFLFPEYLPEYIDVNNKNCYARGTVLHPNSEKTLNNYDVYYLNQSVLESSDKEIIEPFCVNLFSGLYHGSVMRISKNFEEDTNTIIPADKRIQLSDRVAHLKVYFDEIDNDYLNILEKDIEKQQICVELRFNYKYPVRRFLNNKFLKEQDPILDYYIKFYYFVDEVIYNYEFKEKYIEIAKSELVKIAESIIYRTNLE